MKTKAKKLSNEIAKAAEVIPAIKTKDQIIRRFEELRQDLGRNFLEIGLLIHESNTGESPTWKACGYDSLGDFIEDVVGVSERTGYDLMAIAEKWSKILPAKRIEEVAAIGWTKMRALCPVIDEKNIDDWEARAEQMTFRQLKTEIERRSGKKSEPGNSEGEEVRTFSFRMVGGQIGVLERALATAAKKLSNDKRNVQLEAICAEFLSTYEGQEDGGKSEEASI